MTYKLDLEKTEESEIKLPTFVGLWRKQGNFKKTSTSASLTMRQPLTVHHNKLWRILKDMGTPDHLTCFPINLYIGQEATVRNRHRVMDWFKIGKGVHPGSILSPCLFYPSSEYIMQNARVDETQAGIKSVRRHVNNLRYTGGTKLIAEGEEGLKSLLMKVKEKSERAGLKLNLQETKIKASVPSFHGK